MFGVAWVTTLGPHMDQVEYRLQERAGCELEPDDPDLDPELGVEDPRLAYRLAEDARALEWIGEGLREVGIEPGTLLDEAGKDAARALADGLDPRNGDVLVAPKMAVHPAGKLPAEPLLDAVGRAARDAGSSVEVLLAGDERASARYGRAVRGVRREGAAHRVPVGDLARIATAAGVKLDDVYGVDQVAVARKFAGKRIRVGNRGYDLVLDLPKSYSVLYGLAGPAFARDLEDAYMAAARRTVTAMEGWAGYAVKGHHGDGRVAERVDGTGMLGWLMLHRTARPVDGQPADPHLHVHATLLNLVRDADGTWRTVGAGGRDIHRHARAADAFLRAQLRAETSRRWGIEWARDQRTGVWEIVGVGPELRDVFSKRHGQVHAMLERLGIDPAAASRAQAKDAAARSRDPKVRAIGGGDLRDAWRGQAAPIARRRGVDVDQLLALAAPGPPDPAAAAPAVPTPAALAAWVFRAEDGLTAHQKVVTRADVLAEVMDALPAGLDQLAEAEQLVDQVLAVPGYAVALPPGGQAYQTNSARYTSGDIVQAEETILAAARERYAAGVGRVDPAVTARAIAAFEAGAGYELSGEQRAVIERLTTAGHGVDAVIGVAGAGKTSLMAALRAAHEAAGHTIAGASTAATAAVGLQAGSGIESTTVAAWLWRLDHGQGLRGVDVLVLDEAAMMDDRQVARLVAAAGETGTQVVALGDPQQLRAPGVGGAFAAVHTLVDGLTLTDNYRQRDQAEQAALTLWRDGDRRTALAAWAERGQVHAVDGADQAQAAMLTAWNTVREQWADPHDRIQQLLLLAATNADADQLSAGAQAIRLAAGELTGPGRHYRLAGAGQLRLHVGDQVLLRRNERRGDGPDVLNGYRGIVEAFTADGGVRITWRQPGPDGPQLVSQTVSPDYIAAGNVALGYALTVAKSQGLSAEQVLVYGSGMDPRTAYPALSRHRGRVDLYLPRELLESDEDATRLGEPANADEALARALNAYATELDRRDHPDQMVIEELGHRIAPIAGADAGESGDAAGITPDPGRTDQPEHAGRAGPADPHLQQRPDPAAWVERPFGALSDAELAARLRTADRQLQAAEQAEAAAAARQAEQQRRLAEARAGNGPAASALAERREHLAAALQQTRAAEHHQAVVAGIQADRINPLVARERELRDQLHRGRIRRAVTGTSRRRIEADLEQLRAELDAGIADREQAHQAASLARQNAEQHARAALPPATWNRLDSRTAAAALAEHDRQLPARRDAAVQEDLAAVGRPAPGQRAAELVRAAFPDTDQPPGRPGESAVAVRARRATLADEQQHRADLDPAVRQAEDTDRTAARAEQRQLLADAAPLAGRLRPRPGRQNRQADRQPDQPPDQQPGQRLDGMLDRLRGTSTTAAPDRRARAARAVETDLARQRAAAEQRRQAEADARRQAEQYHRRHPGPDRGPDRGGPGLGL